MLNLLKNIFITNKLLERISNKHLYNLIFENKY